MIRSYGPGKFTNVVDQYVWGLTGDGADVEAGDSQDFGWYGLVKLTDEDVERVVGMAAEAKDVLTDDEIDLLNESEGVIVSENDQGFVHVEYFDDAADLEDAWNEVEAAAEEFYAEEGEEGEEGEEEDEEEGEEEAEEVEEPTPPPVKSNQTLPGDIVPEEETEEDPVAEEEG